VKKNNLTRSAFAVLLLSSTVVSADQQYPAADFQPEVIYQNSELIAKSSPAATAKSAPAAKAATEAPAAASAHDSQYPAADFKPEVLYVDPNYKPSTIVPKVNTFKEKATSNSIEAASAPVAEKESSSLVYLLGLVALGLAGFYLFKKPTLKTTEKPTAAPTTAKKSYALNTGVAKYLNRISGTGVSRYIETNVKAASAIKATGVAKYVAKQASAPTAVKAATGVDKYVRDRG
jgi:hypothetical protein